MKAAERTEESRTVRLGDAEVNFRLRRSARRRSVSLHIDERGLTVSVPWRCSEHRLLSALRESEQWVLKRLAAWVHQRPAPITWRTGDELQYLGRPLSLEVATGSGRSRATRLHDRLLVLVADPADTASVQKVAVKWLRAAALELFVEHAVRIAPLMRVPVPRVFLSCARTRWGSCNSVGAIRVNWRLVQTHERLHRVRDRARARAFPRDESQLAFLGACAASMPRPPRAAR